MKEFRVFFSWQSDLSRNQTKRFIEDCIESAKEKLSDSILVVPDEATRDRFGTPDIMDSIFDKINECDLFIADVSIVGKYALPKQDEEEDVEYKLIPNPNVLLELGFAAASKTWDRCICFANTKFGGITDLPFDLNHRRITPFSFTASSERKKEQERISGIICKTIKAYLGKPLPKKDFSTHIVGGYNFDNCTIEQRIIPFNKQTFSRYNDRNKELLDEILALIKRISAIHLPQVQSHPPIEPVDLSDNIKIAEAKKDPVLLEAMMSKITKKHAAKVDDSRICGQIKKNFGADYELCADFFDLGGLQECSSWNPFNPIVFEGSDQEKEKHELLCDLACKLSYVGLRKSYVRTFDGVIVIPLAIKNISTKHDERITISVKIIQGQPIQPTCEFFNPEIKELEGIVFDNHLVEEILKLPENSSIKHDSNKGVDESIIPQHYMPVIDGLGMASEPASTEEDYELDLKDYVQELNEDSIDEYCFTISALRPNETLWLDKVMLVQPTDGKIVLSYSIKSNNSTGTLSETLSFEETNCLAN